MDADETHVDVLQASHPPPPLQQHPGGVHEQHDVRQVCASLALRRHHPMTGWHLLFVCV